MTIEWFDEQILRLTEIRRKTVAGLLEGHSVKAGAAELEGVQRLFLALPREGGRYRLKDGSGRDVPFDLSYELDEIEKDLIFLREGETALEAHLAQIRPEHEEEVKRIAEVLLLEGPFDVFVSDRDGTVNNYCARYLSSVQSAYNALYLCRFARRCSARSLLLTSAPLAGGGIVDVSVMPEGVFAYAGSKGREYRDEQGGNGRMAVAAGQQVILDELNNRIQQLLERSEYRIFARIGSGFQRKFGQSTVARQDMIESVSPQRSQDMLERVRAIVQRVDPAGTQLTVEDTGSDIEVMLNQDTSPDGRAGGEFDKGTGLAYLDTVLGLGLTGKSVLVCGDTRSDLAMVRELASRRAHTMTVFVTSNEMLRREVLAIDGQAQFVSSPDSLVSALNSAATASQGR